MKTLIASILLIISLPALSAEKQEIRSSNCANNLQGVDKGFSAPEEVWIDTGTQMGDFDSERETSDLPTVITGVGTPSVVGTSA